MYEDQRKEVEEFESFEIRQRFGQGGYLANGAIRLCYNQPDMLLEGVWKDYNNSAKIELTIRELDYDHHITNVPMEEL